MDTVPMLARLIQSHWRQFPSEDREAVQCVRAKVLDNRFYGVVSCTQACEATVPAMGRRRRRSRNSPNRYRSWRTMQTAFLILSTASAWAQLVSADLSGAADFRAPQSRLPELFSFGSHFNHFTSANR
jgi:hypothetical protein